KIGVNIIIVHGGGKEITETANALGVDTTFIDGQRFTDEKMIEVVLMVLAGLVNKEIVNLINTNGGNAVGLCGVDNMLLKARKLITKWNRPGTRGRDYIRQRSFPQPAAPERHDAGDSAGRCW
ncbi:MAG: acetylglutamate kinase, partial [Bacteroidetes bacterium]|nr:acetylglutamate kinase [Bacteroidota bacterium]